MRCVLVGFLAVVASVAFAETIEIRTAADLRSVAANLGATYELMNDIDLSGVLFEPIGGVDGWGADKFTGTFHGNGHKIVGLKIDDTGSYGYVGLFRAANGATITDLQIVGEVSGRDKYCGGLVGLSVGSYFGNCVVQVSLRGGQCTSLALRRCRTGRTLSYLRVKQKNLGRCPRAVARTSSESK